MRLGLIIPLLALLSAGCSTMQIATDSDPEFDFGSLKTYAWKPNPPPTTGDPRLDRNELLFRQIDAAVDAVLQEKGFRETSLEDADFHVGYHMTLAQKVNVRVVNDYYGWAPSWYGAYGAYPYGPRGTSESYVYEFDEGTFILDIADAREGKLIWRGTLTDEVNFTESPERRERNIQTAAQRILADFPPKPSDRDAGAN